MLSVFSGCVARSAAFSARKTTTARILAKELNGIKDLHESFDVIEMDAASRTGVDDIRELLDGVRYRPVLARNKIYIMCNI